MTATARELGCRIPFQWHGASLTWGWQKVTGMAELSLPSGSCIYGQPVPALSATSSPPPPGQRKSHSFPYVMVEVVGITIVIFEANHTTSCFCLVMMELSATV